MRFENNNYLSFHSFGFFFPKTSPLFGALVFFVTAAGAVSFILDSA